MIVDSGLTSRLSARRPRVLPLCRRTTAFARAQTVLPGASSDRIPLGLTKRLFVGCPLRAVGDDAEPRPSAPQFRKG
jgi:hypothetical protein